MLGVTETEKIRNAAAEQISKIISSGRCVAWIGAGLSPIKSWSDLICLLSKKCGVAQPGRGDDLRLKAQECKDNDTDVYRKSLRALFPDSVDSPHVCNGLLNLGFHGYVTTNFDSGLSRASQMKGLRNNVYAYNNSGHDLPVLELDPQRKPIFYIHGHIDHLGDEDVVLAEEDFEKAYASSHIQGFLDQLVKNVSILFVGCSLSEKELAEIFKKIQRELEHIPRNTTRLILLPIRYKKTEGHVSMERDLDMENSEETELYKMKIQTIRYDNEDGNHEAIFDILCRVMDGAIVPDGTPMQKREEVVL